MTSDLRDQLRRFGEWHDETQAHVEPLELVDRVRPVDQRSRPALYVARHRPAVIVGLAAVLVVLVIGVPLLLSLGGRRAMPADDPRSTTRPPIETTLVPDSSSVAPWYGVVDVAGFDAVALFDIIEFEDSLVAIGQDDAGRSIVIRSDDGIDWSVSSTSGIDRSVIIEGGPGLIALGPGTGGVPNVSTSRDGLSWTIVEQPRAQGFVGVDDVVVGGPGYVAVGWAFVDDRRVAAVWTSVDGLQWTRAPHDPAVFASGDEAAMRAVAAGNGVLVAVGEGLWGVWTSPDGVSWSEGGAFLVDERTAGREVLGELFDVVYFEGAFITAQGWSVDGLTWTRFDQVSAPDHPATLFEVVGDRLIAQQRPGMGNPWTMHASADGRTWSDLGAVHPGYSAITAGGPGMVSVGEDGVAVWFDDESEAAAYGTRLVRMVPPLEEDEEMAQSLLRRRRQAIESMLAAYNQGRFGDWLASFLEQPELGNGLGPDVEASLMVAAGRWELTGACVSEPEVAVCPTHRSDAFYGAGGFDHDARFVFRFAPRTDDLIGYEVAEDTGPSDWFDEHGAFEVAFLEWLAEAHPGVSVSRGTDWFGIATFDMPVALQYVAEFVAQSNDYPIRSTE